jgi:hypothetical protein
MDYQHRPGGERIIREQAPRQLSLFSKSVILFGGVMQQIGWIFLCIGLIFSVVFISNSEFKYIFVFDGEWVEGKAVLREIKQTSSRENNTYIYAYSFDFTTPDGKLFKGVSYNFLNENYRSGNSVDIRYKSKNPNHSKIKGMRSEAFNSLVGLVLLFPIIGVIFVIVGLLKNIKALNLIINGKFTKGRKISAEPTGVQINRMPEYKFVFSFDVSGRTYEAICRTHETRKVEDEALEIILFDEQNPEHAIVYDAVTNVPKINSQGHLQAASLGRIGTLIFPFAAMLTILCLLIYFFS